MHCRCGVYTNETKKSEIHVRNPQCYLWSLNRFYASGESLHQLRRHSTTVVLLDRYFKNAEQFFLLRAHHTVLRQQEQASHHRWNHGLTLLDRYILNPPRATKKATQTRAQKKNTPSPHTKTRNLFQSRQEKKKKNVPYTTPYTTEPPKKKRNNIGTTHVLYFSIKSRGGNTMQFHDTAAICNADWPAAVHSLHIPTIPACRSYGTSGLSQRLSFDSHR